MKKNIVKIMALGMALMMIGCGGSRGNKSSFSEKDLETISDKQAEDALIKVAEQYDSKMTEEETETEAETFDPHEVDIHVSDMDLWENHLFDVFGLDDQFPRPKTLEEDGQKYNTFGYKMDSKTGEIPEGAVYEITLRFNLYEDYMRELLTYLNEKYHFTRIDTDFDYATINQPTWIRVSINTLVDYDELYLTLKEREERSIEGEVSRANIKYIPVESSIEEGVKENNPDTPENQYVYGAGLTITYDNGRSVSLEYGYSSLGWLDRFQETYGRLPQEGDRLKVNYWSPKDGYDYGTGPTYEQTIYNVELLNP